MQLVSINGSGIYASWLAIAAVALWCLMRHVEPPQPVERALPCGERGDRAEKLTRAVA